MEEMKKNVMGINKIARTFGIPSRTLRRRFAKNEMRKLTLGKHPVLGFENEKRLVFHIQKLEKAGFIPEKLMIRRLAYQFAEKLGIQHTFNKKTEMAGSQWLQSFLERNPELSIKQAEGPSLGRGMYLNREKVNNVYDLLIKVLADHNFFNKPDCIYNMEETSIHINYKQERGETFTVIACCNAIGHFLPPIVIMKGVNKKTEFQNGLPPGSKVFMNRNSPYIDAELFHNWLTEHFIPQKPQGKVLLILEGHSFYSNAIDMLEIAEQNDVILFSLPSHKTRVLQPLAKSFSNPFRTFFATETNNYMQTNPQKKVSHYMAGQLIGNAWIRAATPSNAIVGFNNCGIYPVNPNAIPKHLFAASDCTNV